MDWGRIKAAIWRYKWVALVVAASGVAAGYWVGKRAPKEYTAAATIWIESPQGASGPIRAEELLPSEAWAELMRTYQVIDTVVIRERLYLAAAPADSTVFRDFAVRPGFTPGRFVLTVDATGRRFDLATANGIPLQDGVIGDSVGRQFGLAWQPDSATLTPGATLGFQVLSLRDASEDLKARLQLQVSDRNANFMRVSFSDPDPGRAARTLNAVVDRFVALAADLKSYKLRETSRTLEQQLNNVEEQLRLAERELEGFKTRVITQPNEATPVAPGIALTQPTVLTRYFEQKASLDDLRRDRQALERLVSLPPESMTADAFLTIPSARQSPDLNRALTDLAQAEADLRTRRERFTDEAREVREVLERLRTLKTDVVPNYVKALAAALRRQENDLDARIGAASRELQSIPQRSIVEQRLMREVAMLSAMYTDVQGRYQTARLAEASAIPDVQVLDRAVPPQRPSRNQAIRLFGMIAGASVGLALALAVLLDRLDRRVRYPSQITKDLGLPILGVIPSVGGNIDDPAHPARASFIEAFRTLRLSVIGAASAQRPLQLAVSSTNAGDGKSFVALNLALSMAEAGKRTLLVDGDIRRGALHRNFRLKRQPGLVDLLLGGATLAEVLRTTPHPNLALIPAGARHPKGPEAVGSEAMRQLAARLAGDYDVIIYDAAPLTAGVDPLVFGMLTGQLIYVVRAGASERQAAEYKLELAQRLPLRILGAVLNDVPAKGIYSYAYAYVYEPEAYAVDAGEDDEEPARLGKG